MIYLRVLNKFKIYNKQKKYFHNGQNLIISKITKNLDQISIKFKDFNKCYDFPNVLLRDMCRCSQCYHESSKQKLYIIANDTNNKSLR